MLARHNDIERGVIRSMHARYHRPLIACILAFGALAAPAAAQDGAAAAPATRQTGPTGGLTREQMWPAPTAEDWKKPCLVKWQRTYEDAQALSKQTGKPILICVNMDGEIASEHYAGIRYRQPEIVKLYEPYVPVIASVYRHTPRDYDEKGERILCPRFGSVTCGEHIWIEPKLFDKYFEGQRVAPRHIGVELDGKEMYDVFYAWDTDTIFDSLKEGIARRPAPPEPVVRGDRSIVERVASPDNADRTAVEKAYLEGDAQTRRALLEAAAARGDAAPLELLRLAVNGFDPDMSKLARSVLAKSNTPGAIDLIAQALRVPLDGQERESLIGALSRLGTSSPRARTLAAVHKGLSSRSETLNVERWSAALEQPAAPKVDDSVIESRLANQDKVFSSTDAAAHLETAEAFLLDAQKPETEPTFARALYRDALETALKAEKLGAKGWRVDTAIAVASYSLGQMPEAYQRAAAAMADVPQDPKGWNAMLVIGLFADARKEAITQAVRAKTDWPPQWLADVHSAYALLARHPEGDDTQVAAHYDFLRWLRAGGQAGYVLDDGLRRFPTSHALHDRLRARLLEEKGFEGLEPAYETMLQAKDAAKGLEFFAGYAAAITAEFLRRGGRGEEAREAYGRALAHYDRAAAADLQLHGAADHFAALAHAGCARIAYEAQQDDQALADVMAAMERKPSASATADGLNITAVDTAKMLLARLVEAKMTDRAAKLKAALDALDPQLLELPAYERPQSGPSPDARRAGRPDSRPSRRRRQ
jgi:hypothetical protein